MPGEECFRFVEFLVVLSARLRLQPENIYLYVFEKPTPNYWWKLTEALVEVETLEKTSEERLLEKINERGGMILDLDLLILKPFAESLLEQQPGSLTPFLVHDLQLFQLMDSEQLARLRSERLANCIAVCLWRKIWAAQFLDLVDIEVALKRNTLFAVLVRELLEEADPGMLELSLERSPQREGEILAAQVDALAKEAMPVAWDILRSAYEVCCRTAPELALPFYRLACLERKRENFSSAYEYARCAAALPLPRLQAPLPFPELYEWVREDELAICAYWVGRKIECFQRCTRLLTGPNLPDSQWERVVNNRDFAVDEVKKKTESYPQSLVSMVQWWSKKAPASADVTLTITSCRRPQLLATTLNSFLQCCEDIHRIARWVCVDDGSSEQDLAAFREMYPFIELIVKERAHKGHAKSMNLLREVVTTPYWLHLEDDWHFLAQQPYIALAAEILDEFDEIAQVLFNRNHAQTLACRRHWGGEIKRTSQGRRFRLHEYFATEEEIQEYHSILPPGARHHAYWPHFSLCPSLMRSHDVLGVGPFQPEASFFEMEFARRYVEAGFKSASLDVINLLHIGRLTWESGDNAYSLNGEIQFKPGS